MVTAIDASPGRVIVMLVFGVGLLLLSRRAEAQLGSLISPGALSRAHASLEGVAKCQQCHARGRQVAADRCLSCHRPVADRIAAKVGVHRAVKDDCVTCHVEHAGVDGELRPFDRTRFDHTTDTSFRLDGKHADIAQKCDTCHKTRSFLAVKTTCASCHNDVHKGTLGSGCERCHSTRETFKATRQNFDHRATDFALTGAHQSVTCSACHKTASFTVARFTSCASCHETPHPATMTGACSSCHVTESWKTKKFDHSTTSFPLVARHATVACASCHKASPIKVKTASSTCATCHADPHKGEFAQDCAACHSEKGFTGATFDHATKTAFPLTQGHGKSTCVTCHKNVVVGVSASRVAADFRGSSTACVSCHADPHRGELEGTCSTCHSTATFTVASFTHKRSPAIQTGAHAVVACEGCHKPAALPGSLTRVAIAGGSFAATPTECASCHRDVHLGQVGANCATCHSVDGVKFAADQFRHDRSKFHLTGAHATVACDRCHKSETAAFPAGAGTAMRLTGISSTCRSCHVDVHLGQVSQTCETCHDTVAFPVKQYTHTKKDPAFFTGPHLAAACATCHKPMTGRFPAGRGTAIQFKVGTDCAACHTDVHRGSMGTDCRACHKVTRLKISHVPGPGPLLAALTGAHPEIVR